MEIAARAGSTSRKRTVAYSLAAAVVVFLLVAGLTFANSIRVTKVTNHARSLHWANATTGTSALTRAGLVQAVTFAELDDSGIVEPADFEFAMDQVESSTDELQHLFEGGAGHDSYAELARFLDAALLAVADLDAGDVAAAKERISGEVESSYVSLSDALAAEQEAIQMAIEDNTSAGRAMNGWVVFILLLAVPGSAVVAYFVIARRQMAALRDRNRLELEAEREVSRAKDSFIAGLSHELRTPLTSIYGFAEVLADGDVQGREATEETAQIIANEAAEMTRMVDDLLVASRLESTGVEIEVSRTNVGEVVEDAIEPFRRAGMDVEWEPTTAFADTDRARLRHVLVNLISNATRHGGPAAGIEVSGGDGVVDIEVWDNGEGVAKDRVDTLFQRFVHDDDAPLLTGSVGLGLAVASRVTTLMGGELRYQRFGHKTYFVVRLPVVARTHEEDEPQSVASMVKALSA